MNWGLMILGITQMGTAVMMLMSSRKPSYLGVQTLRGELTVYRHIMVSLWLVLSMFYFMGSCDAAYEKGAVALAVMNCIAEIIAYWTGFRRVPNAKRFPLYGTLWMGIQGVLVVIL